MKPLHIAMLLLIGIVITGMVILSRWSHSMAIATSTGDVPLNIPTYHTFESPRAVKDWLAHGGDINSEDDSGDTPLIVAAQTGQTDLVQYLLDHGAKIDTLGTQYYSAWLKTAMYYGRSEVNTLNHTHKVIHADHGNGPSALMAAAQNGQLPVIKLLLSRGAKINQVTTRGFTALSTAAESNQLNAAQLLLTSGAEANARWHKTGYTPLMFAILNKNPQMTALLIDHKADVTVRNNMGMTALQIAKRQHAADIVKLLLQAGAKQ